MFELKKAIQPFAKLKFQSLILLVAIEAVIGIAAWYFSAGVLIPSPFKVLDRVVTIVNTGVFWDNFFSSLSLTVKGMLFSIVISTIISYLALVPIFRPLANFIVKCRYLTLTGLVFLFTLITKSGSDLKLSLLVFGIVPFFVTSLLSIIDGIDSQEYDLCTTLRMNKWETLWEVVILGRLDMLIEVMRQNFAIAWMMIAMVEGLNMSEGGLGTMLIKSNKYIDLSTVFAVLFIIFIIGVAYDYLLGKIRFWLFPYAKLQMMS